MYKLPRSVWVAQARIARFMAIGQRKGKLAKLVCAACEEPWEGDGSPADCPKCRRWSYAVSK